MRSPVRTRAEGIRTAAQARRPRCWCGCPEAGHRIPSRHARRICLRCGERACPTYVPCSEIGARVTSAHHVARALSDQQVRANLDALAAHVQRVPAAERALAGRIPEQRRPGVT